MKTITLTILTLLMFTSVFALPQDATTHGASAQYLDSEVREGTFWESITTSLRDNLPLSVGTFTQSGTFDKDWLIDETMNVRMDETTYNTQCWSSKFILEFYKDGVFKKAYSTGNFKTTGNVYLTARTDVLTNNLGVGSWEVVDYIECQDADLIFKTNNPEATNHVISKASVQTFQIREKNAPSQPCALPDGKVGAVHCEDNKLVQDVRTNCELKPTPIQTCTQACSAGACVKFEEQNGTPAPEQPTDQNGDGKIDESETPANYSSFSGSSPIIFVLILLAGVVFIYALVKKK